MSARRPRQSWELKYRGSCAAGFNELRSESNRGDHAIWSREAFSSKVESRAVIRARPWPGEPERDIHTLVEGVQLRRNQALIVIHAEHPIEFTRHGAIENRIRRKRPADFRNLSAFRLQRGYRRGNQLNLFEPESTFLSRVGVQSR